MNKSTSNDTMEREFAILQSVEKLQPPTALYDKILARAEGQLIVSKKWIAAAAAILAIVLCVEIFVVLQSNKSDTASGLETLVQQESYQLYE